MSVSQPTTRSASATAGYGPIKWALEPFRKYAQFTGRARRREYWWFTAMSMAINTVGMVLCVVALYAVGIDFALLLFVPLGLFWRVSLFPRIAVTVRRLHDVDRSGWWYLIVLVPMVGLVVLVVFMFLDGTRATNQWGPSPKYG